MRLLFVKESLAWPRSSGHDVHTFHLMRSLADLGHTLALAVNKPPVPRAIEGLPLDACETLPAPGAAVNASEAEPLRLSKLQERFRSYWGIDPGRIRAVGRLARSWHADAVVVVGLNVLPYLGAVENALRVWYAADEWAWHHLSQVRLTQPGSWSNVKQAIVKGLYERAYGPLLNRVWVVTEADRRAMAWVAGVRNLDLLPNGVDTDHYAPVTAPEKANSCVFWGRLDFGPNIQALQWFCRKVWPNLRHVVPGARFTIYGFQPEAEVKALAGKEGIDLIPDLQDLRSDIARHQVVVLPFVSGGGIKNKLLEAASMGKAVVGSVRAGLGLRGSGDRPFLCANGPSAWVQAIRKLWDDADYRQRLGADARRWVMAHHTWEAAARTAAAGLTANRPIEADRSAVPMAVDSRS